MVAVFNDLNVCMKYTCCCAVKVTTWLPGANDEAANWDEPVI
jgi:hypothetical protein